MVLNVLLIISLKNNKKFNNFVINFVKECYFSFNNNYRYLVTSSSSNFMQFKDNFINSTSTRHSLNCFIQEKKVSNFHKGEFVKKRQQL